VNTPVTQAKQNVCSDGALDVLAKACITGPDSITCQAALIGADACAKCLAPFRVPFEQSTGLWACAASFVTGACRHQTGCAADCAQTSCNNCDNATENQCYALVSGNQCSLWFNGADCAANALAPGELCSRFSYANYGEWLRAIGDHFCGNGP
jgi:hypothetical protein